MSDLFGKTTHHLNVESRIFIQFKNEILSFLLRQNDRKFSVGDYVVVNEIYDGKPTGRSIEDLRITYVLLDNDADRGLSSGYCVLQFEYDPPINFSCSE